MKHKQSLGIYEHCCAHVQVTLGGLLDVKRVVQVKQRFRLLPEKPRPGLLTLLCCWMFAGHGHRRWSLALALVACMGIGFCIIWQQF